MDKLAIICSDVETQLIALWLYGRSEHTQRAYRADVGRFLASAGKPLASVTLADLQAFADALGELAQYHARAICRSWPRCWGRTR